MFLGVDRARRFDRPTLDCLKANGQSLVIRYLDDSWGQSAKSISEEEARAILDAGLSLLLVFETCGGVLLPDQGCPNGGASYFTRDQGIYDAQHAVSQARNIGYPNGLPIFFAVDFDASLDDLQNMDEYFNGIYDILNGAAGNNPSYVLGIYGSYRVCEFARDNWAAIKFYWQTYAWSGSPTKWLPEAQIRQIQNGVSMCGVTIDKNESTILGWIATNMSDYVTKSEFEEYKTDVRNSFEAVKTRLNQVAIALAGIVAVVEGIRAVFVK